MQESAQFKIIHENNLFVLLVDLDNGKSITNDAVRVVPRLAAEIPIAGRRVYYRDTIGRFDELRVCHDKYFMGFGPCSPTQQEFFSNIVKKLKKPKKKKEETA